MVRCSWLSSLKRTVLAGSRRRVAPFMHHLVSLRLSSRRVANAPYSGQCHARLLHLKSSLARKPPHRALLLPVMPLYVCFLSLGHGSGTPEGPRLLGTSGGEPARSGLAQDADSALSTFNSQSVLRNIALLLPFCPLHHLSCLSTPARTSSPNTTFRRTSSGLKLLLLLSPSCCPR